MDLSMTEQIPEKETLRYNEELADFVDKEFERRKTDRRPYELQWRLNMEFLNGNQYLDIDSEAMNIVDEPRQHWYSERECFNQISTISETRIARLSRQKPIMRCRPASSEQNDLSAAKVSSMLLTSTWNDEEMNQKYDVFISWLETCGTAFYKTRWNQAKGRVLQEENEEQSLEEGTRNEENAVQETHGSDPFQSKTKRNVIREGDIETAVCSPFEIYPDNTHGGFEDTKSVIHARAYSLDEIEDNWGVRVEEEKVDVVTMQNGGSGMGGLGYSVGSFRYSSQGITKHALVKEYYERPCKRYPYGRLIIVAGKKTLYAGILPYKVGRDEEPDFPFVRAVSIPVVGSFWGKSIIERCIPIQRRYNTLRNRKAEYLNLVTIGQWYSPEGVVEDEGVLNNEPGNIIRYRNIGNGVKPEPVIFPNLPNSFEMEVSTLLQEFTAVSGVSELSRFSQAPAGVKSGIALSIANEADDSRISLTTTQLENVSVELGKKWLRLFRQFVTEPRLIRYVGPSSEIDVLYWDTSDLRSDDIILDNASALAETPAQRRQMVFDLMATGLFNRADSNPFSTEGVRKILDMLEWGHWETGVNDDEEIQEQKAKRENRQLLEGMLLPLNDYDNDDVHIREHYRFMMSTDYDEILATPEGIQLDEVFKMHVGFHQQRLQQMMMEQQMAEMGILPGMEPPTDTKDGAK